MFGKLFNETKTFFQPTIALHSTPSRPTWTPRRFTALAHEGMMNNVAAYRCVRMISEAAAHVPWVVFEGDDPLISHPLLSLLGRPNRNASGFESMERWYSYLLIAGNSYMQVVEDTSGLPSELHVLRPDRMKVIPSPSGWPEGFEYTVDGRTTRFVCPVGEPSPILHTRLMHPTSDHYGMSPLEAAAWAVDIHNAASKWSKSLLDNSARPSGALVYTGSSNLTQAQFCRLKEEMESHYQGSHNAGRPLLLEGGLDWKSMSISPKEMEFIEVRHVVAREIALAFGVPPMLLGIPGDNTYANYAEANRTFWRQTILPFVNRTATALDNWLSPRFGSHVRLSVALDKVEALASERESRWERISNASFLTINEKREAMGYSPVEGGDVLCERDG